MKWVQHQNYYYSSCHRPWIYKSTAADAIVHLIFRINLANASESYGNCNGFFITRTTNNDWCGISCLSYCLAFDMSTCNKHCVYVFSRALCIIGHFPALETLAVTFVLHLIFTYLQTGTTFAFTQYANVIPQSTISKRWDISFHLLTFRLTKIIWWWFMLISLGVIMHVYMYVLISFYFVYFWLFLYVNTYLSSCMCMSCAFAVLSISTL